MRNTNYIAEIYFRTYEGIDFSGAQIMVNFIFGFMLFTTSIWLLGWFIVAFNKALAKRYWNTWLNKFTLAAWFIVLALYCGFSW